MCYVSFVCVSRFFSSVLWNLFLGQFRYNKYVESSTINKHWISLYVIEVDCDDCWMSLATLATMQPSRIHT